MSPPRLALLSLALAAALGPGRVAAAIPVAIYPIRVPGLSAAKRADLHGVLQAGLVTAARRGILAPRSPLVVPAACGESPTPTCLAGVAGKGLTLAGRGELRSGVVLVTAAFWDRKGARTREVRFAVDLIIENVRPVGDAIMELELEIEPDGTVTRDMKPQAVASAKTPGIVSSPPRSTISSPPGSLATVPPREPTREPPAAAKVPAVASAPAAAATPTRLDVTSPRPPPSMWKRKAGPWLTGVGVALLAGGAAVGYLNHSLSDDLAAKRAAGTLSASDRSSFDRVDRYNALSIGLFSAGGAAVAAGTWLWIAAPSAAGQPVSAGAGGRF